MLSTSHRETSLISPKVTYRDIVAMIKQINSISQSSKTSETTSKSLRIQMQFETNDRGNQTPRKVSIMRGTVAANEAFTQMTTELLTTDRTFPPSRFKKSVAAEADCQKNASDE